MNVNTKLIKCLLIGGILVSVLSFVITIFIINKKEPTPAKDEPTSLVKVNESELDNLLLSKGVSQEELGKLSPTEKDKIILDEDYTYQENLIKLYSDNPNATEYPKDLAIKDYRKFLTKLCNTDFSGITQEVTTILETYNLSENESLPIAALYTDVVKMKTYDGLPKTAKESILKSHKNPAALAIDTLLAYPRRREAVILDTASKTPVFEGIMGVGKIQTLKNGNDDYNYYMGLWEGEAIRTIYQIDLTIPETSGMYCIVLESTTGELRIAGYYGDSADRYITVAERMEMGVDNE